MPTCNMQELMSAANCFANSTTQVLTILQTTLLCKILQNVNPMASCDIQSLLDSGKCFACVPPQQLTIIQTELLCEILQAGGTGGQGCIVCHDNFSPDPPPVGCDCALQYGRLDSYLGYWDSVALQWQPLIQ